MIQRAVKKENLKILEQNENENTHHNKTSGTHWKQSYGES